MPLATNAAQEAAPLVFKLFYFCILYRLLLPQRAQSASGNSNAAGCAKPGAGFAASDCTAAFHVEGLQNWEN